MYNMPSNKKSILIADYLKNLIGIKKNVILSYSEHHFIPKVDNPALQYSSAAQIAKNIYNTLSRFGDVYYADNPVAKNTELLVTTNNWSRCKHVKADYTILFPAVAHLRYTREQLMNSLQELKISENKFDRLDSIETIEAFENGLSKTDLILLIGNNKIKETYLKYGVNESKLKVINYGIDYNHFEKRERGFEKIIFIYPVTSISLRKGFPFLMNAWRKINETKIGNNIELHVLGRLKNGDFNYENYLSIKNVEFKGEYFGGSEIHLDALNQAHYVILPSLSEGQAGTLLESMSCGCVPIATQETGINAVEYSGWDLEPGSVESIINTIHMVISNHSETNWKKRSDGARNAIINNHSWEKFNCEIEQLCSRKYSVRIDSRIFENYNEAFSNIILRNREIIRSIDKWLDEESYNKSNFLYGLPGHVKHMIDAPVNDEITYSDAIVYLSRYLKKKITYLELGVSFGKNFYQVLNQIQDAIAIGFDIEKLSPVLRNQLKNETLLDTWKTVSKMKKEQYSSLSEYTFNDSIVQYISGDIFQEDSWKRLEGKKFNLIFSDAFHEPRALFIEHEMLEKFNLLDADEFIMIWDDLGGEMEKAFYRIYSKMRLKQKSIKAFTVKMNGWLGQNEFKHNMGFIMNLCKSVS